MKEDYEELLIAKQALIYIEQNNFNDLKALFDKTIATRINSSGFDYLFKHGKDVIQQNTYPSDSLITVTYISSVSLKGKKQLKEFIFPFYNDSNPDKSMFFEIKLHQNRIVKLMLSKKTHLGN